MSKHDFMVAHIERTTWWEPPELRFFVKGPGWFRRATDRVLRYLFRAAKAEVLREEVRRTFRPAPSGDLLERMRLNQRDMMRLYNQEAAYVFCGPEVYDEVLRQARVTAIGPLSARIGGPHGIRVSGVEVVVVPWMTGALLVPDWRKP